MADLLCEAYDVCYGTGPADPAPQVVSLPYRTRDAARTAAAALNTQARSGEFDPTVAVTGKAFFVRVRPGQDLLPVATTVPGDPPAPAEIRTALVDAEVMVPIFVRHLNPTGFVQLAVLTRAQLLDAITTS